MRASTEQSDPRGPLQLRYISLLTNLSSFLTNDGLRRPPGRRNAHANFYLPGTGYRVAGTHSHDTLFTPSTRHSVAHRAFENWRYLSSPPHRDALSDISIYFLVLRLAADLWPFDVFLEEKDPELSLCHFLSFFRLQFDLLSTKSLPSSSTLMTC